MTKKELGRILQACVDKKGWDYIHFAHLLEVKRQTVWNWFAGNTIPRKDRWYIAKLLDLKPTIFSDLIAEEIKTGIRSRR